MGVSALCYFNNYFISIILNFQSYHNYGHLHSKTVLKCCVYSSVLKSLNILLTKIVFSSYFYFKSKPLFALCIKTSKKILVLKLVSSLGKSDLIIYWNPLPYVQAVLINKCPEYETLGYWWWNLYWKLEIHLSYLYLNKLDVLIFP